MPIPEAQLATWSHQGSIQQSAATYGVIRSALSDPRAPFANRSFDIFLQGSYSNDTNIFADSDVDIVICLTTTYYFGLENLGEAEKARFTSELVPGTYSLAEFKAEVVAWLTTKFGNSVQAGNKAVIVHAGPNRREVDVLVCAEYRRYTCYAQAADSRYYQGVTFWTGDNTQLINFPSQHSANCTSKHQATSNRFKPTVRVFKNIRNYMLNSRTIRQGLAPSYFLEGMLYNVPTHRFNSSNQFCVTEAVNWLRQCDSAQLICANDLFFLLSDHSPLIWRRASFLEFLSATERLWVDW